MKNISINVFRDEINKYYVRGAGGVSGYYIAHQIKPEANVIVSQQDAIGAVDVDDMDGEHEHNETFIQTSNGKFLELANNSGKLTNYS